MVIFVSFLLRPTVRIDLTVRVQFEFSVSWSLLLSSLLFYHPQLLKLNMGGLKLGPKISLSKYFLVNEEIFNAKSSMEEEDDEKKIRGARENTINLCRIGGARYGGA